MGAQDLENLFDDSPEDKKAESDKKPNDLEISFAVLEGGQELPPFSEPTQTMTHVSSIPMGDVSLETLSSQIDEIRELLKESVQQEHSTKQLEELQRSLKKLDLNVSKILQMMLKAQPGLKREALSIKKEIMQFIESFNSRI